MVVGLRQWGWAWFLIAKGYWDFNPGPGVGWLVGHQATKSFFDIPYFQHKRTQTLLRYLTGCISLNILGLSTHIEAKN